MISRGPQPQFVGPTPSDAVIAAGTQAQKQAEMFAQGIQEGARNYMAQKQVDQQKAQMESTAKIETEKRASESETLRIRLLSETRQKGLLENGPMDYVDNKDQWLEIFGFLTKGDKGLAESMYEGGAGAINRMGGTDMLKAGLIENAPSQENPAAPAQAQALGQTPSVTPSPSVVPPAAVPPARPAGMPPQAGPMTSQPAPRSVQPQYATTPEPMPVYPAIDANGKPVAGPSTESFSITSVTKGLPDNAVTRSANSGLEKIANMAMGNIASSTNVTPKEQAAIKQTVNRFKVAENGEVAKFLAAGGKVEAIQRAADELNEAFKDPRFAQWFRSTNLMSDKDAESFNSYVKNDIALQKAVETARHDQALEDDRKLQIALSARTSLLRFQQAAERMRIMAANTKDKTAQTSLDGLKLLEKSVNDYNSVLDKARTDYIATHKDASDKDVSAFVDQELAKSRSGSRISYNLAAQLYAHLGGMELGQAEIELKEQFWGGLPFKIFKQNDASKVDLPALPGAKAKFGETNPKPKPTPAPRPKFRPGATLVPEKPDGTLTPPASKGSNYATGLGF